MAIYYDAIQAHLEPKFSPRQFLRSIPFEQCRMFASVGDASPPAALVAAASFAEHATAFELTRPAADRFTRSAPRNKLFNRTALARLSPTGRLYIQSPASDGDWATEIRSWLPVGSRALHFSASQSQAGWKSRRNG